MQRRETQIDRDQRERAAKLRKKRQHQATLGMLCIIGALVLLIVFLYVHRATSDMPTEPKVDKEAAAVLLPYSDMVPMVDPLPITEMVEPETDTEALREKAQLVGRLAEGIYKTRTVKGTLPYWFCGEPHEGEEARLLALDVAWHIVDAAERASEPEAIVNPWEVAGLADGESGFDLCTLGLYPRQAAYDLKILKKNRRTVSHTREDVERAISDPRMKKRFRSFDLGMIQTLDMHYRFDMKGRGEEGKPKDLLTWDGFRWQAEYMHSLMVWHNTPTPSLYWPGKKSIWKLAKVVRAARKLGATEEEMPSVRSR